MAKEWKTWTLRPYYTIPLIVFNLSLIVAIITLTILSSKHNGFVTVKETDISSWGDLTWTNLKSSQFRWTVVPNLVVSIFSMLYAIVVSSSEEREPYVALKRDRAVAKTAKKTVLLDYPGLLAIEKWFVAFRNKHLHLGVGMVLSPLSSLALVPLSSNLFQTQPFSQPTLVDVTFPGVIDFEDRLVAKDLQPALDIASAILVHGASAPSWMTKKYAVDSFTLPPQINDTTGNVTVDAFAYWVEPRCRIVPQSDISANTQNASDAAAAELSVNFTNAGCDVFKQGTTFGANTRSISMTIYQKCDSFIEDIIGTLSGSPTSNLQIPDLAVISCNPAYRKSFASIHVMMNSPAGAQILSVKERNPETITEVAVQTVLEDYMQTLAAFYYAQKLTTANTTSAEAMRKATEAMYQTFFASLTSSQLIQPLQTPQTTSATFSAQIIRLYVVAPTAYAVLGLLLFMLVSTIWLTIYVHVYPSILLEEPIGLLGRAALVRDGNVMQWVDRFFDKHKVDMQDPKWSMSDYVKEHYTVSTSKCYFDEGTNPDKVRGIMIDGLDEY